MTQEMSFEKNRRLTRANEDNIKARKKIICKPSKGENNFDTDSPNRKIETGRDILNDYLECSSVHGLQYFGNVSIKVGIWGKLLWSCTMITGFVCLSLMVVQFLQRYYDNPTTTFIKSFYTPIFLVPFPAVTICPYSPISSERASSVLKTLNVPLNMTDAEALLIIKYGHLMGQPDLPEDPEHFPKLKMLLEANELLLIDFLKMTRPCEDVAKACWWDGKKINCNEIIKISHSTKGMCCSFNYHLEDYTSIQSQLRKSEFLYTDKYGPDSGLTVVLHEALHKIENIADTDDIIKSVTNGRGILIFIHHSMEFLGDEVNVRPMQGNQELQIKIAPTMNTKPGDLYHVNKAGKTVPICTPDNANNLKYFPKYCYSNCYANCRIEAMLELCGCVPYYHDPIIVYYGVNSCEIDGLACIRENMKKIRDVKTNFKKNFTCICETPCEDIVYSGWPDTIAIEASNYAPIYTKLLDGQGILRVYMASEVFMSFETVPAADEIYLLASIGGIFSLFLGCSFLSAVEIIYFNGLFWCTFFSRPKQNTTEKKQSFCNNFRDTETRFY